MPAGLIVEVDFFVHLKECALLNDLSGEKKYHQESSF